MKSKYQPQLSIVISFAVLILTGALALFFFGFRTGEAKNFIEALFTSTSGVCVTGLTVLDIGKDLSFTGQVILLILIQLGGLGLLTVSTWVLLSLKGQISLSASTTVEETLGGIPRIDAAILLKRLIVFTFISELLGAIALFTRFSKDYPIKKAIWLSIFHSISAFCNAGFSLFSDSLTKYRGDPVVNLTIILLIISGGIGFVVVADILEVIKERRKKKRARPSLHTKIVLTTTAILIVSGWILFFVLEYSNTMQFCTLSEKLWSSLFLSVTARTAGFNTLPTGHLTNMTLVFLILLMVVGASPGSTGGGIKTSTAAIIWAMVKSHILNRPKTEIFHRSIPGDQVAKALAVTTLYFTVAFSAVTVLEWTQLGDVSHLLTRGIFLEHVFEVISALSTVGLSTGVTPTLSSSGLCVLITCMYIGRIGPLLLASSLVGERQRLAYSYPEESVLIG